MWRLWGATGWSFLTGCEVPSVASEVPGVASEVSGVASEVSGVTDAGLGDVGEVLGEGLRAS